MRRQRHPGPLKFIGIDLAWKVSPHKEQGTGYCVIAEDGTVEQVGLLTTDREILELVESGPAWVGIDASLKVPPEVKMRSCERDLRSLGVRVLPSNREFYLRHYGGFRGEGLRAELETRGFEYFGSGDRALFEVYPHAALIAISRGNVPRYKEGPREVREAGAATLQRQIREWEPSLSLSHRIFREIVDGRGAADKLDALLAAASLYNHRLYAGGRSTIVGDEDDGYILLPKQR